MSRLQSLMRKFEEGWYVDMLNGRSDSQRSKVRADMQARYDHLAGVRPRGES